MAGQVTGLGSLVQGKVSLFAWAGAAVDMYWWWLLLSCCTLQQRCLELAVSLCTFTFVLLQRNVRQHAWLLWRRGHEHVAWTLYRALRWTTSLRFQVGQVAVSTLGTISCLCDAELAHFWHCCILADRHMPAFTLHPVLAALCQRPLCVPMWTWGVTASVADFRLRVGLSTFYLDNQWRVPYQHVGLSICNRGDKITTNC